MIEDNAPSHSKAADVFKKTERKAFIIIGWAGILVDFFLVIPLIETPNGKTYMG